MRARSWIALGWVAFACGGTAFSPTSDNGDAGQSAGGSPSSSGSPSSGGKGGRSGHAGRSSGGTASGTGGKVGTAGSGGVAGVAGAITTGGDVSAGGEPTAGGNPAFGGEGGAAGASTPPIDKSCPPVRPANGAACVTGLRCSYGDDIRPSCHPHALCVDGAWSLQLPKCTAIEACAPIAQGSPCDAQASPSCTIQSSIFCACTGCSGAGPCTSNTVWVCTAGSGPVACPALIPNEGQACAGSDVCTYGSCATGEKVSATCKDATWHWKTELCPV